MCGKTIPKPRSGSGEGSHRVTSTCFGGRTAFV